MTHEPTRLLDDASASAGLRRDLAAAVRHRVPYDASAGAARFEASLAKGAGAASSGWGVGTLGLGALILGGLIGGGLWVSRPPEAVAPAVELGEVVARPVTPKAVVQDMPREPAPSSAPVPPAVPAVVAEDMSHRPDSAAPEAGAAGKKARGSKSARGSGAREAGAARAGSADYLREARSLQAARGFLGRDPAEALARAQAGAAEFKAGAFAQEWEGVAVLALFELDRRTDAERRAGAFLARYPNGPYAAQVREALERP